MNTPQNPIAEYEALLAQYHVSGYWELPRQEAFKGQQLARAIRVSQLNRPIPVIIPPAKRPHKRSWKAAVRVKANAHYTCQECGSTEYNQAHHPIPEDDNILEPLCAECHSRKHPNLAKALFFSVRTQPYWHNISASSLGHKLGVSSRTIIRIAKRLEIPQGFLTDAGIASITANTSRCRHRVGIYTPLPNDDPNRLFTPPEVASIFNCHINSIYNLLRGNLLKSYKVGKQWRISLAHLQDYYEKQPA
jgi:excisionase family DNA binding protein